MATYDVFSWLLRHEDGRRARIILIETAVIYMHTMGSLTEVSADTYMDSLLARWRALAETENLEELDYVLDSPVRVVKIPMVLSLLVAECQGGDIGRRLALVLEDLQDAKELT